MRKTPDHKVQVRILTIAKKGKSKEDLAEMVSLPDTHFRRQMAALVDRGLLTFDRRRKVWVTTDKGYRLLKS